MYYLYAHVDNGGYMYLSISEIPTLLSRKEQKRQRNLRLEMTDNSCEVYGKPIDKSCHIHRRLPCGAEDRNKVDNIRVLCGECWHELEKKPHIHGYQHLEDNTRYKQSPRGGAVKETADMDLVY